MVEVKCGEVYTADFVRSGDNGNGKWLMTRIKDSGKSRKEITLWIENTGCGLEEGMNFRVAKILGMKLSARKDNSGVWHDTCSANVEVEVVGAAARQFAEITGEDDELPF